MESDQFSGNPKQIDIIVETQNIKHENITQVLPVRICHQIAKNKIMMQSAKEILTLKKTTAFVELVDA